MTTRSTVPSRATTSASIAGSITTQRSMKRAWIRSQACQKNRAGAGRSSRARSLLIFATIGGQSRPSSSFIATTTIV